MVGVEEDEKLVSVGGKGEENVVRRSQMIGCGHHWREEPSGGKKRKIL